MAVRADTLYSYDARGRMLRSNERGGRPAPRLFLGLSCGPPVTRFGASLADDLVDELAALAEQAPAGALRVPEPLQAALRATLERQAPVTAAGGGPAYRFPQVIAPAVETAQITEASIDLVRDSFPWLVRELPDWQPCFAVVRDGRAVSVCFSARNGTQAAEAGVETLPEFRGHHYAVAVTAAWGAAIRAGGRVPLYSTAWDNSASQAVARNTGLIRFGSDATWT